MKYWNKTRKKITLLKCHRKFHLKSKYYQDSNSLNEMNNFDPTIFYKKKVQKKLFTKLKMKVKRYSRINHRLHCDV